MRKDVVRDTTPQGFMEYARFMKSIGLLSKIPASMKDIELPTVTKPGD